MESPTDPNLINLGLIAIPWYGFLVVIGVVSAAFLATWEARRRKENPDHVWSIVLWGAVGGLIGARLYHILSSPVGASRDVAYYFFEQPVRPLTLFGVEIPIPTALLFYEGGLGILGAIVGVSAAIWLYSRRHDLNVLRWLDIVAPGALLAQAIGRWGNFFNQELYGLPTELFWGITITNVSQRIPPYTDLTAYPLETLFHPVFFYQSLWSLLGVGLLLWISRRYTLADGSLAALYLIWYPLGRLLTEFLRPDAWTLYSVPVAQVVSLVLMGVGVWLWYRQVGTFRPQAALRE